MIWLAAAGGILAAPFVAEALRKPVSEADRTAAPGQMAQLSQGNTYYRWFGSEGPVAICVHGLSTPSFVWEAVAERLVAAGYRVLTYDLYGRGLSDCPKGPQTPAFFNQQLLDLMADQGIEQADLMCGYSMGGSVVTGFAAAHPDLAKRYAIIAPGGLRHDLGSVARFVAKVPVLGDWLYHMRGAADLRKGIRAEAATVTSHVENIFAQQIAATYRKGFTPAVLSSLRHMLRGVMEAEHRAIHATGTPLLAVWAEDDAVIPIEGKDILAELNPNATQVVIKGEGHEVTYSAPDQVAGAVLDWAKG